MDPLLILLVVLMLVLIFIGFPVVFAVGISAFVVMLVMGMQTDMLPNMIFTEMDSFSYVAIPLFILAAELLNEGKLTDRIIEFSRSLVGSIRGGLAHVNILASMLFGGISGSTTADTAAIGTAMIPAMEKAGYHKDFSIAVTITSSIIGGIIPPSVLMIVFGSLTQISIGSLFLGGIIPGILVGIMLMITSYLIAVKRNYVEKEAFSWKKIVETGKKTLWATLVPIVIIVSISSGTTTASEAGVLAVFTAFIVGRFVYKEIRSFSVLRKILVNTGLTTSMIMLLLGFSSIFSEVLTRLRFQNQLASFLESLQFNSFVVMLILVLIIFIMGMFIDTIVVLTLFSIPLLNIATQLGYNPIHFGLIMVMTSLLSPLTPPVGVLLFLGASIGKERVVNILKIQSVFLISLIIAIILVILFPEMVTFLPEYFIE